MNTERVVRICIKMNDGPIARSIRQVLLTICGGAIECVDSVGEADLVIFTNVRDIERTYNREKQYAFFNTSPRGDEQSLPEGCAVLSFEKLVAELVGLIGGIREKLLSAPKPAAVHAEALVLAPVRPDALRILVIDDTPKHIASAKLGLAGHHLTTVMGYEDAMEILAREKFDAVLTDLHLPMSSKTLGDRFKLGELVNYGMLLMVEAARQGAKFVAIVTDLNHHDDPFSAAFDHFSQFPVQIENAKVLMMHAPMNGDGAKDWAKALERLMK